MEKGVSKFRPIRSLKFYDDHKPYGTSFQIEANRFADTRRSHDFFYDHVTLRAFILIR